MARTGAQTVAAAVVVAVLVLAGCSDGDPAEYDEAYRTEFLDQCTGSYGRPGGPQVCGCWYDALVDAVAFEDLPSLDDLTGDDFAGAPTRLPGGDRDVPLRLLATCVRSIGSEPALEGQMPPPTTPRPPTTPTTATTVPA